MADDAAGKDAKKADESAVTSDTEKAETADESSATSEEAESTPEEATDTEVTAQDSDDSDDEDISLEPDEEEKSPKRMQGRHWFWTAAAVVVIAIAAGTAIIGRLYEEQRVEAQSSREALTAAQDFANAMITIDSAKIDDGFNQTLDRSTGAFKKNYEESRASLRQVMIENKASAKGVVLAAAVKSATPDKVEVLMFIDQAVANVAIPGGQLDRSRVQVTMEKVDGRWLASDVELA
ncbi:hypothetical protein ACFWE3_00700 [Mycobacteriaceae bacterium NPDC060252]